MDIRRIKKAHLIGVGGIGVSAILRYCASREISLSGTDDIALPPLDELPVGKYYNQADSSHVSQDVDILIYSPAVREDHPERQTAKKYGIAQLSYPEALALVTTSYDTIAISGTHGKSTSTSIAGKLFEAGEFDPSVIVGANVHGWNHNLRLGNGDLFIVEACEYRRHMMLLSPQTIVLTNLELDHPDYYRDLADIKDAFRDYVRKLPDNGLLVVNNDDVNLRDIARECDATIVRYGVGEGSDLVARNIRQAGEKQQFELVWKGTSLGEMTTLLPGIYNIYNILAAVAVYLSYGGKSEIISTVLRDFEGAGRRFEIVGQLNGTTIISDYAHHPTALNAVVKAAQARYKGKKILTIFRPHQRERTLKLFDDFVNVIAHIPHLILVEIFDVAGRDERMTISSKDMMTRVMEQHPHADLSYAANLHEAEQLARARSDDYDVILVAGAGDADRLAYSFVQK